uniref:Uncharacterized protein n=1 Tax=Rhizophora mucronata TaxID=61149 RepID=A0A2P2IKW0_RHIMU
MSPPISLLRLSAFVPAMSTTAVFFFQLGLMGVLERARERCRC